MLEVKFRMEKEKAIAMDAFKRKTSEMERQMANLRQECERIFDEKQLLEKDKKSLISEREKMKERIKKLRSRKGKFDSS